MKYTFLFAILLFALPGCIGVKKYGQYVRNACQNMDTSHHTTAGAVKVSTTVADTFTTAVAHVKKGPSYFIPAIFYWGIKENYECTLNPRLPANIFRKTCSEIIDSSYFPHDLNEHLEISIDSLPTQFNYDSKSDVIFVLVAGITVSHQTVIPYRTPLSISYKLYKDGAILKQGNIITENRDKPLTFNSKSRKKITGIYMQQYERNMRSLSSTCLKQLVHELSSLKQ